MAIASSSRAGKPGMTILVMAVVLLMLILGATVWYFNDDDGAMAPDPAIRQID